MGITRSGRFGAITNVREPGRQRPDAPSRGHLVSAFLQGVMPGEAYVHRLEEDGHAYNGYNVLLGTVDSLWYQSNRGGMQALEAGLYGLSNAALNTPWPKVQTARERLVQALRDGRWTMPSLLEVLSDTTIAADDLLPQTGVPLELERTLSAMCIQSPSYGTRTTTAVVVHADGQVQWLERTLRVGGQHPDERSFAFSIATTPITVPSLS